MIQDKASLTKSFGKTARISCRASGSTGYIHWYRQKDNEDLRRAFYVDTSNGQVTYDEGTDRNRFKADDSGKVLVIDKVEESDTAVYYCAAWDSHNDCHLGALRTKTTRGDILRNKNSAQEQ
ncbi:KV3AL protein, partial [Polypterus senegalus]